MCTFSGLISGHGTAEDLEWLCRNDLVDLDDLDDLVSVTRTDLDLVLVAADFAFQSLIV